MQFASAFRASALYTESAVASPLCPDDVVSSFHSTCSEILDNIALLGVGLLKPDQTPGSMRPPEP